MSHEGDHAADSIEPVLTEFVTTTLFKAGGEKPIAPDERLIGNLVDSIDVLNLILFVEDEYGIRIEDDEVVFENFETLSAVASLVSHKLTVDDSPAERATDG